MDAGDLSGGRAGRAAPGASRSWWSGRWLRALGGWMSTSLLATGRLYVRRNQVEDLDIQVGAVLATVREPDGSACRVRVGLETFADDAWERVVRRMAEKIAYTAQLLNDELPRDVEDVFHAAGVTLFPERRSEATTECTCPDWTSSCRHVAAVLMQVGDMLDEDPFLLLRLRGRTREQVMAALRSARASMGAPEQGAAGTGLAGVALENALTDRLGDFWRMGAGLDALQIRVCPPEVEMEVIKLLGVPRFADDEALLRRLTEVYQTVSRRALDIAYDDSATQATDDKDEG